MNVQKKKGGHSFFFFFFFPVEERPLRSRSCSDCQPSAGLPGALSTRGNWTSLHSKALQK